ncbi:MAG: dynamin, partial [Microcystis sp.]
VQLQRRSTKYLDDPAFLNNPQQIPTLLESDIDAMMTELSKKLNSKAATLYGQIEERSGLNFNPFAASSLEPEHAHFALDEIQIKKTSVVEKAVNVGRTGAFNTGAGASLGGFLGALVGGVVGVFAGGVGLIPGAIIGAKLGGLLGVVAGSTKGVIEGIKDIPKQDQTLAKQEISKILRQYLEDSQRLCMQTLNQSIKSLEKFMRDELTSQIKRQKESYDKTLQSLQQARKLSQEQGSQRANQLQTPLKKLMQMQQEVEQLAIAVTTQSENRQPKAKPQTSLKSPPKEPVTVDAHADYGDWADG